VIGRCPACAQLFPVLGNAQCPCPYCGAPLEVTIQRVRGDSGVHATDVTHAPHAATDEPEHGAVSSAPRAPAAWEDQMSGRAIIRFARTLGAVLVRPTTFFRALAIDELGGSLSFAILVLSPALLVHTAALYFLLARPLEQLAWFTCVTVLFFAYLATFYQAASTIAARRRPPLTATIRGTCFGLAPMVLAIVPVIGALIGIVWTLVIHAIALRELHGLGRGQAVVVVLLPVVVMGLSIVYR
jgi:hypothetical protein